MKLREIKESDLFWADFEGERSIGEVMDIDIGQRKVLMTQGENTFWYDVEDLYPIPINAEVLEDIGFIKGEAEEDRVPFKRGPFTIIRGLEGETWMMYRDEVRHVTGLDYLHQLQHHHRSMTNFGLIFRV